MTTIRAFFLKIRAFFVEFSKKGRGDLSPFSCTPGKIIPRYVLLFTHFPKRLNFQVSLLPIFFSANLYFLKPNYFRSTSLIGKKQSRYYHFCFPEQGTPCYYTVVSDGGQNKVQSKHSLFLNGECFLHFTVPMMLKIGMFQ